VRTILIKTGQTAREGDSLIHTDEPTLAARSSVLTWKIEELQRRLAAQEYVDRVAAEIIRLELTQSGSELERIEQKSKRLVVLSRAEGLVVIPKSQDLVGRFVREG